MKKSTAKSLASKLKNKTWESLFINSHQISYGEFNLYRRKISTNYWQYTVSDGITSCTFQMYTKER